MDPNNLLLWIVGISSATALLQVVRMGVYGSTSRKVFYAFVLAVAGAGWFAFPTTAGYVAGGCWCVLLLMPSLIVRRLNRLVAREDYKGAASVARWMKRLYPFDDGRTLVDTYTALTLAKDGSRDRAVEILNRYRHVNTPAAKAAVAQLYKMEERWQEFLAWADENVTPQEFERNPALGLQRLRSLGETGQLELLLARFEAFEKRFHQFPPYRNIAWACVLTYFGKTELLRSLFDGPLRTISPQARERYLSKARAAESHRAAGPGGTPQEAALFARLENEIAHESRYGAPAVASVARPVVTYGIIAANVIAFAAETLCGGSTNPDVAISFGALLPSEAAGGGWWRLLAASFLHFGVLHLAMNMLALLVLGPFVERILLRWRYTALYLGAGIGSMGAVILMRHFGLLNYDILVGASGSIMGLVGATAAIALRDSRILKTRASTSMLRRAAFIIVLQVIFDALTPQVSMAGHLGGLLSGFLLVQLLGTGR